MQIHLKPSKITPRRQRGAFLVVALILIIILAGLGVALMSETVSSLRVSKSYSKHLEAQQKADSIAQYGKRIFASYTDRKYPTPLSCTSAGTCNVINNTYPYSGRPTLAWSSGAGFNGKLIGASENNAFWDANGFEYEGTFSGAGNARLIAQRVGTNNVNYPHDRTYRIVGYATDSTGTVKATSELYHTYYGYLPDPDPNTTISTATNGCPYGQCALNASGFAPCGATQAICGTGTSQTFVPPGWTCSEYFITGLGFTSNTCNFVLSKAYDGILLLNDAQTKAYNYYLANGTFPTTLTQIGYASSSYVSGIYTITISAIQNRLTLNLNVTSATGIGIETAINAGLYQLNYRPTASGGIVTWVASYRFSNLIYINPGRIIPRPFRDCAWDGTSSTC